MNFCFIDVASVSATTKQQSVQTKKTVIKVCCRLVWASACSMVITEKREILSTYSVCYMVVASLPLVIYASHSLEIEGKAVRGLGNE